MATATKREGESEDFFTAPNLKRCKSVFKRYMQDAYGVRIDDEESDANVRKFIFEIMKSVFDAHAGRGVATKKMNDITMNVARDAYLEHRTTRGAARPPGHADAGFLPAATATHPNVRPLDRDREVYGNRSVPDVNERPRASALGPLREESAKASYDLLLAERAPHPPPAPDATLQAEDAVQRMTDAEVLEQMERMRLEREREDARYFAAAAQRGEPVGNESLLPPPPPVAPPLHAPPMTHATPATHSLHSLHTPPLFASEPVAANAAGMPPPPAPQSTRRDTNASGAEQADRENRGLSAADFVIDATRVRQNAFLTYLSINGFDRDWTLDPLRYRYTVKTVNGGLGNVFKEVVAIQATMLILPMEVPRASAVSNAAYVQDKPTFQYDFGMGYPYVLLTIEGFEGVYDGTNEAVRKSFCKFVYNKQYKTPNGRGYVILEPMQDEIKRFEPAPLASLRNLTLSIQRPSGLLFNQSRDDYTVQKVEYEAFNEFFLKIALNKYYDRNEFYKGDMVALRGVRFSGPQGTTTRLGFSLSLLEEFLNREEGHEIIQADPSNPDGFLQTFHIYAPGSVDQAAGRLIVDAAQVKALVKHNESTSSAGVPSVARGAVLNMSLQNVVSFRLWHNKADILPLLNDGKGREERIAVQNLT